MKAIIPLLALGVLLLTSSCSTHYHYHCRTCGYYTFEAPMKIHKKYTCPRCGERDVYHESK